MRTGPGSRRTRPGGCRRLHGGKREGRRVSGGWGPARGRGSTHARPNNHTDLERIGLSLPCPVPLYNPLPSPFQPHHHLHPPLLVGRLVFTTSFPPSLPPSPYPLPASLTGHGVSEAAAGRRPQPYLRPLGGLAAVHALERPQVVQHARVPLAAEDDHPVGGLCRSSRRRGGAAVQEEGGERESTGWGCGDGVERRMGFGA